ncbi:MAG: VPLPA-CTERM sorting domain-containing protein [Proteobacteria bacterium]|nr:VPLPA-CTERM sorting domain-containing protein [Pseudomonadota bacterium]
MYWTGLVDANFSSNIWSFYFNDGRQGTNYFGNSYYTLAVQSGDIGASVVPLPAAVWLLGSGLIFLAGVARRK